MEFEDGLEMTAGFGMEQDIDLSWLDTFAIGWSVDEDAFDFTLDIEADHTLLLGLSESIWYEAELEGKLDDVWALGLRARRWHGIGPNVTIRPSFMEDTSLFVAWMPLNHECWLEGGERWNRIDLVFGMETSL